MKILKLLSKIYLSIIIISLLLTFSSHSEDPVDIWNVEETKTTEEGINTKNLEEKNIPQNSILVFQLKIVQLN